jgi:hypothetical protein
MRRVRIIILTDWFDMVIGTWGRTSRPFGSLTRACRLPCSRKTTPLVNIGARKRVWKRFDDCRRIRPTRATGTCPDTLQRYSTIFFELNDLVEFAMDNNFIVKYYHVQIEIEKVKHRFLRAVFQI